MEDDYTFKGPGGNGSDSGSGGPRFKSAAETVDTLSVPGFKTSGIFQDFAKSLHAMDSQQRQAYVNSVKAIFEFDIVRSGTGASASAGKVRTWTLDLKNGTGSIFLGQGKVNKADIVFSISDDDFVDLAQGKLTGQRAFLIGKLKIKGNMMLATKLEGLFKKLQVKGTAGSSKL